MSNALTDIKFEARNGNHVALSSTVSAVCAFVGVTFEKDEIGLYPQTTNRVEVVQACLDTKHPFIIVSGAPKVLERYAQSVSSSIKVFDEHEAALAALLDFEDLAVSEYGFEADAFDHPDVGLYPMNITKDGMRLWDLVVASKLFKKNTAGRSLKVRWAVAMKMYMDKASRMRVKPFVASNDDYTKTDLTRTYNNVLSKLGQLESQIRENLIDRGYIYDGRKWGFKEVSYNSGKFVCVISKTWEAKVETKQVLKHLVRNEGFEKNRNGAGWVIDVSGVSRIRVRTRPSAGIVEVDLFVMFNRDKLRSVYNFGGMRTSNMLDEFHTIAKHWFQRKRF